jgi:hypothetical protein
MKPSPEPKDYTEIDELLRSAVRFALADTDFESALKSYCKLLPIVAPSLVTQMPPGEEAQRALAFAMFREVWNRVPRPDHDWRPQSLPKPERNGLCPCGSGRKYKQCCGPLAGASPLGGEGLSLLSYVLERIPQTQYKTLPFNRLSPEELGHVASQWIEQGRHAEAVALLQPLFAHPAKLDARHEYAFDMPCDGYLELGHPIKRLRLAESMMQSPDRVLKSAGMHRRCTILADKGDYPAAWKLFKEAQRIDPDNPSPRGRACRTACARARSDRGGVGRGLHAPHRPARALALPALRQGSVRAHGAHRGCAAALATSARTAVTAPDAFPISLSCFCRWHTPGVRSPLWSGSPDTGVRLHSFPRFPTVPVRRKCSVPRIGCPHPRAKRLTPAPARLQSP